VSFRGHFEYFTARVDLIEDHRARHNGVDVIVFGRPLLDSLVERDRLGEAWKTRTLPRALPLCRNAGIEMDPAIIKEEVQEVDVQVGTDPIVTTVKQEVTDVGIGTNSAIAESMEVCETPNDTTPVSDESMEALLGLGNCSNDKGMPA
jgi:hypothetical protein